ncbi:TIGR01777 family oxidoreductase [Lutibacter sp. TH_r2]|uniref:TIGR01777 family oxidoreductase n=1 Tax=Lutibacter sp. TH_r2 TaxID=3082083 RepID=UPI002954E2D8|nr:TIGR01777 family oxidoreductase [Lutibacter sp. TH_r2]MDV7187210.1 TIGR01777 family oxidoreductase [Lutibacter sp. TH_r2]
MKTILITGGTGLIGKTLQQKLILLGFKVTILSRRKSEDLNVFYWNISEGIIEEKAIKQADYIIHLAGAGIADKRWTAKRKEILVNSRVNSTQLLLKKVKELNPNLKGFIAASGIGYYGAITSNKIYNEEDIPGSDFLAEICKVWEKESFKFQKNNIRTVVLRTSVVFSEKGGALEKIINPIKKGIGAVLGTGKQYMPWIHIDDLCTMYVEAITNKNIIGIYNAAAPEHITNKELTLKIAAILNKKIILPAVPSFMLKLIFGKMAIILLEGSRVSSKKIEKTGFSFKYTTVNSALKNLL